MQKFQNRVLKQGETRRTVDPASKKKVSMFGMGGSTSLELRVMKNHVEQPLGEGDTLHTKAVRWNAQQTGQSALPRPAPTDHWQTVTQKQVLPPLRVRICVVIFGSIHIVFVCMCDNVLTDITEK